jgi:hypothetical protein
MVRHIADFSPGVTREGTGLGAPFGKGPAVPRVTSCGPFASALRSGIPSDGLESSRDRASAHAHSMDGGSEAFDGAAYGLIEIGGPFSDELSGPGRFSWIRRKKRCGLMPGYSSSVGNSHRASRVGTVEKEARHAGGGRDCLGRLRRGCATSGPLSASMRARAGRFRERLSSSRSQNIR